MSEYHGKRETHSILVVLHELCNDIAAQGANNRYDDMGADTAEDAYATAKRYVYKRMGIAMMKGLAPVGSIG